MTQKEMDRKIMKICKAETEEDKELRNIMGKLLVMNSEELEKVLAEIRGNKYV